MKAVLKGAPSEDVSWPWDVENVQQCTFARTVELFFQYPGNRSAFLCGLGPPQLGTALDTNDEQRQVDSWYNKLFTFATHANNVHNVNTHRMQDTK